jgi:hypothetical protein
MKELRNMRANDSRRVKLCSNGSWTITTKFVFAFGLALVVGSIVGSFAVAQTSEKTSVPAKIDFNRDIRPILAENCFACHGPDESHRATDFRLDQAGGIETAVTAGDPDASELYQRVISDDKSMRMPPLESKRELSVEQIELLRQWIEVGGQFQTHWSFVAPTKPERTELPITQANPIDQFLAAELSQHGLEFSPQADKSTLIRRVAFTLTGLPPTLDELKLFFEDESPEAYETMVDRYLSSPHYGEEMARHWLDLARYGDTHGMHLDNERHMWAYRDWVVNSFNRNQRFDEFTIEQLAGDLLPNPSVDQLVATGFNRCNVTTGEGGAIDEEFRFRYAVDRTNTAMQVWTGLTAECAACHDHKFDPISAKEYYSLYAFFNSAADPAMDGNALLTMPVVSTASEEQAKQVADYRKRIAEQNLKLDAKVAALEYQDPALQQPPPPLKQVETILFDDEFPSFGRVSHLGQPTSIIPEGAGVPIFSGDFVLQRQEPGLAQDVFEGATQPFIIPQNAKLEVEVWLKSTDPPKAIMLQFFKGGWNHRAVWGDYEIIPWGAPNTSEKVHFGDLPESDRWVHLEFDATKIGLQPGDEITGFAFTQHGGAVYWDRLVIKGVSDPAQDPQKSFRAWRFANRRTPPNDLPETLKPILRRRLPALTSDVRVEINPAIDDQDQPSSPSTDRSDTNSEDEERLLLNYWLRNVCVDVKPQLASMVIEIERLEWQLKDYESSIPQTFIYRDLPNPRESYVMKRGQYNDPGDKVTPSVPAFLPPLNPKDAERPNRLDFANWLLSPEHPLTARVMVNRFWQQIFGNGLVKSSGDFGSQGEPPSHPELLDWLAIHFRESGWDVKALIRLMVTSQTFRQTVAVSPRHLELDPENRLLSRGPRMRLGAEQIRDNALFVSGLINLEMGGRGVRPYQPPNVWEPVGYIDSNTRNYKQDSGPALYRRSLYTFYKRTAPPPFMANFDAPNREQICTKRDQSNTPLQALQLMNDVQHVEAARALAERMLKRESDFEGRIVFAYQVVLSRKPREEEVKLLEQLYDGLLKRYHATPEEAKQLISTGETLPDAKLDVSELAALTLIANTVLNLDETLNRN